MNQSCSLSVKYYSDLRRCVAPLPLVALVINLHLSRYVGSSVRMEHTTPLNEAQKFALDTQTAAVGPEFVEFLSA